MPKVVDHDQYREELARRAVSVFRQEGFNGMSMRRMAEALGVSKGVLYHYFASKQALFEACSVYATEVPVFVLGAEASDDEKVAALVAIAAAVEQDFAGELTLLLDYIRNRSVAALRQDKELGRAMQHYVRAVSGVVGDADARPVLAQMLGLLLIRLFDGQQTPLTDIRTVL